MTLEIAPLSDERGHFARLHCQKVFEEQGLPGQFVQSSTSFTKKRNTLRGMHYQLYPSMESKLVRCLKGSVLDVVIDLRKGSSNFSQHFSTVLDSVRKQALFVPPGFAHGFLTLEDDVEMLYEMSDFYDPELSVGVRWNDPCFGIDWPVEDALMSERDRYCPDFSKEMAWVGPGFE